MRMRLRLYKQSVMLQAMDVFEAVAEPTRRAVLDLLAGRERSAGELVAAFPALTQPAVSRHLRILRESHLVEVRADGTRRVYSLRPAALEELDRWLDRYRRFWGARLDDLERHLDAKTSGEREEEAK
jgi:DNA-binding transcriptional ArsR family regulator